MNKIQKNIIAREIAEKYCSRCRRFPRGTTLSCSYTILGLGNGPNWTQISYKGIMVPISNSELERKRLDCFVEYLI